jgi:adenylosuccinate synthase
MINGVTELSMMKADVLDSFEDIFVCTHYLQDGKKIDFFPFELSDSTQPVLKKIKGWNSDITKCKDEESFPNELSSYIKFLEKELDIPISIVSVGPNRSETIIR